MLTADHTFYLAAALVCAALAAWVAWAVTPPFGVRIEVLSNPFVAGQMINLGWLSYPLTLFWLVGVTNAVNWVDGIDGLAAGVSAIAAATLALMAITSRQPALAILAAALFGSLVGFLR